MARLIVLSIVLGCCVLSRAWPMSEPLPLQENKESSTQRDLTSDSGSDSGSGDLPEDVLRDLLKSIEDTPEVPQVVKEESVAKTPDTPKPTVDEAGKRVRRGGATIGKIGIPVEPPSKLDKAVDKESGKAIGIGSNQKIPLGALVAL